MLKSGSGSPPHAGVILHRATAGRPGSGPADAPERRCAPVEVQRLSRPDHRVDHHKVVGLVHFQPQCVLDAESAPVVLDAGLAPYVHRYLRTGWNDLPIVADQAERASGNAADVVSTARRPTSAPPLPASRHRIAIPSPPIVRIDTSRLRRQRSLAVGLVVATVLALVVIHRMADRTVPPNTISGPYAALLARHLGPARSERIPTHRGTTQRAAPVELIDWARTRSLQAHWRPGDRWAILDGPPATVGATLDVAVNDWGPNGEVFYASPQQPAVPAALKGRVSALGRILGYTPHSESLPRHHPVGRPEPGLGPSFTAAHLNAQSLRDRGYTGKGVTVLVFAFDGFDQADLDMYATTFGLPMFTPEVLGHAFRAQRRSDDGPRGNPRHRSRRQKVLVNARPTVEGTGPTPKSAH